MDDDEAIGTAEPTRRPCSRHSMRRRARCSEAEAQRQQADATRVPGTPKADAEAPPAPTHRDRHLAVHRHRLCAGRAQAHRYANMREVRADRDHDQDPAADPVMTQSNRAPEIDTGATSAWRRSMIGGSIWIWADLEDIEIESGGNGVDLDVGTPSAAAAKAPSCRRRRSRPKTWRCRISSRPR